MEERDLESWRAPCQVTASPQEAQELVKSTFQSLNAIGFNLGKPRTLFLKFLFFLAKSWSEVDLEIPSGAGRRVDVDHHTFADRHEIKT